MRIRWNKENSKWMATQAGSNFRGLGDSPREAVAEVLSQGVVFPPVSAYHEARWLISSDVFELLTQLEGWKDDGEVVVCHFDDPSLTLLQEGQSFQERIYVTVPATYAYQYRTAHGSQHTQREILPPEEDGAVMVFDHQGKPLQLLEMGDLRVKRQSRAWGQAIVSLERVRVHRGGKGSEGSLFFFLSVQQDDTFTPNLEGQLTELFPDLLDQLQTRVPSLCHVLL